MSKRRSPKRRDRKQDIRDFLCASVRSVYVRAFREYCIRNHLNDPESYGKNRIPKLDGGSDPNTGREHEPMWPRIVGFAYKNGVHPYDLVRGVFAYASPDFAPPVHFFLSSKAIDSAMRFKRYHFASFEQEIKINIRTIKTQIPILIRNHASSGYPISEERAALKVMTEEVYNPLACAIVAHEMGLTKILNLFMEKAAYIYAGYSEELDRAFTSQIPPAVKEFAKNDLIEPTPFEYGLE